MRRSGGVSVLLFGRWIHLRLLNFSLVIRISLVHGETSHRYLRRRSLHKKRKTISWSSMRSKALSIVRGLVSSLPLRPVRIVLILYTALEFYTIPNRKAAYDLVHSQGNFTIPQPALHVAPTGVSDTKPLPCPNLGLYF